MKILRGRRIPALCALLVIAGGAGVFVLSHVETHRLLGTQYTGARSDSRPTRLAEPVPDNRNGAGSDDNKGIALRLDDAMDLAAPTTSDATAPRTHSDSTARGVDARAAGEFVENDSARPALNLRVPESTDTPSRQSAKTTSGIRNTARQATAPQVTLDTQAKAEPRPQVKSYSLFNPDYGLRGFMKQGWINQRVAFQGGLGLDDDRINEARDDDLRDNIAVGMGLIVAF